MEQILKEWWQALVGLMGLVAWFVRLEARSKANTREIAALKQNQKDLREDLKENLVEIRKDTREIRTTTNQLMMKESRHGH